jgi:maltooligosyltrehalose trehalohydrolase
VFAGVVRAGVGDDYRYLLDGRTERPDPCSRWQPEGVRGPSRVLDTGLFRWTDDGWPGLRLDDLVVYELHVGTYTPDGSFDAIVPRLAGLRALGVTAIELMPVNTFPGRRGWGYDGLYAYAPHHAYGPPEALARLVDAAHAEGLGVILDVVYNHLGPGSEALADFGPYFTDRYHTPWGDAVNFDGAHSDGVREWAIQNACMWLRDYHVDGLRLDAVHAIYDLGARHVLAELSERARAEAHRPPVLIAESDMNDPRVIRPVAEGGLGLDAQWADEFHHGLHTLLTGEREGYYADFGSPAVLAAATRHPLVYQGTWSPHRGRRHGAPAGDRAPRQFVVHVQNHDQVGNRAAGDRPPAEVRRLEALWMLLSPYTPMLFMGEEYGEERPFQYFTDHIDPFFAEATREGRRREFADFEGFSGEVPDPQDPATFARSVLDGEGGDEEMRALYARLLRLRRELPREYPSVRVDEGERTLVMLRGAYEVVGNFGRRPADVPVRGAEVVLATHEAELTGGRLRLPPLSGAVLR